MNMAAVIDGQWHNIGLIVITIKLSCRIVGRRSCDHSGWRYRMSTYRRYTLSRRPFYLLPATSIGRLLNALWRYEIVKSFHSSVQCCETCAPFLPMFQILSCFLLTRRVLNNHLRYLLLDFILLLLSNEYLWKHLIENNLTFNCLKLCFNGIFRL